MINPKRTIVPSWSEADLDDFGVPELFSLSLMTQRNV